MKRQTYLEVNLSNFEHNINEIKKDNDDLWYADYFGCLFKHIKNLRRFCLVCLLLVSCTTCVNQLVKCGHIAPPCKNTICYTGHILPAEQANIREA